MFTQNQRMAGKILELSIENALKCTYNTANECLQLGTAQFTDIAICGYIKNLEICTNLVVMKITDKIKTISISMYCENQPKSIRTYLTENMKKLEEKLNPKTFFYEKNKIICQETYDLELLRFEITFNSIAYVENIKLDDLLLITGRAKPWHDSLMIKPHKTTRILYDQEEYLLNWMQKVSKMNVTT